MQLYSVGTTYIRFRFNFFVCIRRCEKIKFPILIRSMAHAPNAVLAVGRHFFFYFIRRREEEQNGTEKKI